MEVTCKGGAKLHFYFDPPLAKMEGKTAKNQLGWNQIEAKYSSARSIKLILTQSDILVYRKMSGKPSDEYSEDYDHSKKLSESDEV